MTTSAFAWLDYSDGERRRMFEVIDLFREKGTVDDLGIGSIRDTFADRFFPLSAECPCEGRLMSLRTARAGQAT